MQPASESPKHDVGRRVLVVDPYVSGRRAICDTVMELGYDAIAAGNATEARVAMRDRIVDLVIADCDDPDIDDLFSELHERVSAIAIIMVTTMSIRGGGQWRKQLLIVKPLSIELIAATIQAVLEE